jgi:hypothetical protein
MPIRFVINGVATACICLPIDRVVSTQELLPTLQ